MRSILSIALALGLQCLACAEMLRFYVLPTGAPAPEFGSSLHAFKTQTPQLGTSVLDVDSLASVELSATHSAGRMHDTKGKISKDWLHYSPAINITLPSDFPAKFEKITAENIGRRVLLVLGDRILADPIIRTSVSTPSLQISLGSTTTLEEATQIVDALRSMVGRTDSRGQ